MGREDHRLLTTELVGDARRPERFPKSDYHPPVLHSDAFDNLFLGCLMGVNRPFIGLMTFPRLEYAAAVVRVLVIQLHNSNLSWNGENLINLKRANSFTIPNTGGT